MPDPRQLITLLTEQQRAGFPDLAGARVAAFLPVSDRLLNEIIARELPAGAPVSAVSVEALPDGAIAVRVRLTRARLVPALKLTLTIARQPILPDDPVLVLRVAMGGLMSVAGPALKFFNALPPGIRTEGDRLLVDIRQLLARRGLEDVLRYLSELQITTEAGAVLVTLKVQV